MASFDLSTYEGRQAARDAGNWVGADSNGNVVIEGPGGGAPVQSSSSGGGGGGGGSTSGGGGGSTGPVTSLGNGLYQTVNGQKTLAQMGDELMAAGWPGATSYSQEGVNQEIIDAYARTAQAPAGRVTIQDGAIPTGLPNLPTVPVTNLPQYNQEYSNAYLAAQTEYLLSKMRNETDELAFKKAQQAFSEAISRANLLGTFEGQPTLAAQLQSANLLGTYQGQQTLAAQKQAADIAAQQAGLTGLFQGAPTLAAQQQYWSQGFQQQTQNQKVVQDYLNLLSSLRGPQDYGQYLRTMASTPQGLQSLVSAAMSSQPVAGFGTTGTPTQPVTLQGFMGQATGGAGAAAPTGGTSYDDYMRAASNLPPPSQIAPQSWNAMSDSQRKLLLSMYESAGWNVNDVASQYAASLPKFGNTNAQTGTVRLV